MQRVFTDGVKKGVVEEVKQKDKGTPEGRWRSRAVVQLQYSEQSAFLLQEVDGFASPPEGNVTRTTDTVTSLLLLPLLTISCCFLAVR